MIVRILRHTAVSESDVSNLPLLIGGMPWVRDLFVGEFLRSQIRCGEDSHMVVRRIISPRTGSNHAQTPIRAS
jgi:hypothetical protein